MNLKKKIPLFLMVLISVGLVISLLSSIIKKESVDNNRSAKIERLRQVRDQRRGTKVTERVSQNEEEDESVVVSGTSSLSIFVAGGGQMTEFFNQFAREDDGIIFTYASLLRDEQLHLVEMDKVKKGVVIQNIPSWQAALEDIGKVAGKIDEIDYDLEMWEQSRDEWKDIEESSLKMSQIASDNGLVYGAHLSRRLASETGNVEEMAGVADAFSITIYPCLEQYSVAECTSMHLDLVNRARSVNQDVQVIIGVSVEKPVALEDQVALIEALVDEIDGVAVFSYPNRKTSVDKVKQLVGLLRD